jgi:hypothetical protein
MSKPDRHPYTPIQQNPLASWYYPSFGGGGAIDHVFPPTGGIPAASWNSTTKSITPGQAACQRSEKVSGVYKPLAETVMVENPVTTAVGTNGKPVTVGRNSSGAWTVLVEDCAGTTTTTTTGTSVAIGGSGIAI